MKEDNTTKKPLIDYNAIAIQVVLQNNTQLVPMESQAREK